MDPIQDNTTPSKKDRSGWIIGIVMGALLAPTSAGFIGIFMSNMNTQCNGLSADPAAEGQPGRLVSFYCSSVNPRPDLALWAIILGLILGVLTAVVIGIRARR
jgi:hypothetical protein